MTIAPQSFLIGVSLSANPLPGKENYVKNPKRTKAENQQNPPHSRMRYAVGSCHGASIS